MRFIILINLILFFYSCATYQKKDFLTLTPGGYEENLLEDGTYEVKFAAHPQASRETIVKYCLYRCAELTDERGFKYFEILTKNFGYKELLYPGSGWGGENVAKAKIKMFNEKPEKMTEDIYNAKRYLLMNSDVKD